MAAVALNLVFIPPHWTLKINNVDDGVALAVFVVFAVVRFFVEKFGPRQSPNQETPLLAEKLAEHLAAVEAPRDLGDRLDRQFERVVGRSSLALSGTQAAGALLLAGTAAGAAATARLADVPVSQFPKALIRARRTFDRRLLVSDGRRAVTVRDKSSQFVAPIARR